MKRFIILSCLVIFITQASFSLVYILTKLSIEDIIILWCTFLSFTLFVKLLYLNDYFKSTFWAFKLINGKLDPIFGKSFLDKKPVRFFVPSDEVLLKAAIKTIICSDSGFYINLFDSVLNRDTGIAGARIMLQLNRRERMLDKDDIFVLRIIMNPGFNNISSERIYTDPNQAVDVFVKIWQHNEIGESYGNFETVSKALASFK